MLSINIKKGTSLKFLFIFLMMILEMNILFH